MAEQRDDRTGHNREETTHPENPPNSVLSKGARRATLWSYFVPVVMLFAVIGVALVYWSNQPRRADVTTAPSEIGTHHQEVEAVDLAQTGVRRGEGVHQLLPRRRGPTGSDGGRESSRMAARSVRRRMSGPGFSQARSELGKLILAEHSEARRRTWSASCESCSMRESWQYPARGRTTPGL